MRTRCLDGDKWIERLTRIRRVHLQQWQVLYKQAIHERQALTNQFLRERECLTELLDIARLIQQQTYRIEALSQQRQTRKLTLQTRQANELYALLQLKVQTRTLARHANPFES